MVDLYSRKWNSILEEMDYPTAMEFLKIMILNNGTLETVKGIVGRHPRILWSNMMQDGNKPLFQNRPLFQGSYSALLFSSALKWLTISGGFWLSRMLLKVNKF